jgi:hypothetical protein
MTDKPNALPWWEAIQGRCIEMVGRGLFRRRCKNRPMPPYESEPGNLVFPAYCYVHRGGPK